MGAHIKPSKRTHTHAQVKGGTTSTPTALYIITPLGYTCYIKCLNLNSNLSIAIDKFEFRSTHTQTTCIGM